MLRREIWRLRWRKYDAAVGLLEGFGRWSDREDSSGVRDARASNDIRFPELWAAQIVNVI